MHSNFLAGISMKNNIQKKFLLTALLSTLSFSSYAVSNMKPGLWEHSFVIKSDSGKVEKALADMKKKLADMPPEQRKMMEEIMASKGLGISGKGNNVKVCISKTQAENLDIPQNQGQNCKTEVIDRTDTHVKMKFTCTGGSETSGTGEFTLTSPTSYTGNALVNTKVKGAQERMDIDQKGKWLSANCGNIKEVQVNK